MRHHSAEVLFRTRQPALRRHRVPLRLVRAFNTLFLGVGGLAATRTGIVPARATSLPDLMPTPITVNGQTTPAAARHSRPAATSISTRESPTSATPEPKYSTSGGRSTATTSTHRHMAAMPGFRRTRRFSMATVSSTGSHQPRRTHHHVDRRRRYLHRGVEQLEQLEDRQGDGCPTHRTLSDPHRRAADAWDGLREPR